MRRKDKLNECEVTTATILSHAAQLQNGWQIMLEGRAAPLGLLFDKSSICLAGVDHATYYPGFQTEMLIKSTMSLEQHCLLAIRSISKQLGVA